MSIAKPIDIKMIEACGYVIFNDGRIYSRSSGRFLRGSTNQGYLYYALSIDGEAINYAAHRLVATKFLANPQNLPEVNHKDKARMNNSVGNLEWVTSRENTFHGFHGCNLNPDEVTRQAIEFRRLGLKQAEIAKKLGVSQASVSGWTKGIGESKKRHSADIKTEAIKLMRHGICRMQIANDLGVSYSCVSRWTRGISIELHQRDNG